MRMVVLAVIGKRPRFPVLSGDGITLRQMRIGDYKRYTDILSDPGTYDFLTENGPVGRLRGLVKVLLNRWAFYSDRAVYWSIVDARKTFLGFVAVHKVGERKVALSFGVHPLYRRQHVATRALLLVLGWSVLSDKEIEIAVSPKNVASFELLSKLDLTYSGLQDTAYGQRHLFRSNAGMSGGEVE